MMVQHRRGAVVVFRDTSERERAEAERMRADAIHASRVRLVQAALDEGRRLGRDLRDGLSSGWSTSASLPRHGGAGQGLLR